MEETEKRILVVDDDDAIRTLLLTVLERRGFLVDTARDGAAAMELLDRHVYPVILLDLMMPHMNGWEVIACLAERPPEGRPLILVLTAGEASYDSIPDMVAGTIRKPFDVELVGDTVSACLTAIGEREKGRHSPKPEGPRPPPGPPRQGKLRRA